MCTPAAVAILIAGCAVVSKWNGWGGFGRVMIRLESGAAQPPIRVDLTYDESVASRTPQAYAFASLGLIPCGGDPATFLDRPTSLRARGCTSRRGVLFLNLALQPLEIIVVPRAFRFPRQTLRFPQAGARDGGTTKRQHAEVPRRRADAQRKNAVPSHTSRSVFAMKLRMPTLNLSRSASTLKLAAPAYAACARPISPSSI